MSHLKQFLTEAVTCSEVDGAVLEAPETNDGVVGGDATDAVGGWEAGDTGAVGVAGLALAAWWQAARWRFFSISDGPR